VGRTLSEGRRKERGEKPWKWHGAGRLKKETGKDFFKDEGFQMEKGLYRANTGKDRERSAGALGRGLPKRGEGQRGAWRRPGKNSISLLKDRGGQNKPSGCQTNITQRKQNQVPLQANQVPQKGKKDEKASGYDGMQEKPRRSGGTVRKSWVR